MFWLVICLEPFPIKLSTDANWTLALHFQLYLLFNCSLLLTHVVNKWSRRRPNIWASFISNFTWGQLYTFQPTPCCYWCPVHRILYTVPGNVLTFWCFHINRLVNFAHYFRVMFSQTNICVNIFNNYVCFILVQHMCHKIVAESLHALTLKLTIIWISHIVAFTHHMFSFCDCKFIKLVKVKGSSEGVCVVLMFKCTQDLSIPKGSLLMSEIHKLPFFDNNVDNFLVQ